MAGPQTRMRTMASTQAMARWFSLKKGSSTTMIKNSMATIRMETSKKERRRPRSGRQRVRPGGLA